MYCRDLKKNLKYLFFLDSQLSKVEKSIRIGKCRQGWSGLFFGLFIFFFLLRVVTGTGNRWKPTVINAALPLLTENNHTQVLV